MTSGKPLMSGKVPVRKCPDCPGGMCLQRERTSFDIIMRFWKCWMCGRGYVQQKWNPEYD